MLFYKRSVSVAAVVPEWFASATAQPKVYVMLLIVDAVFTAFGGPGYGRGVGLRSTPHGRLSLAHTESESKA